MCAGQPERLAWRSAGGSPGTRLLKLTVSGVTAIRDRSLREVDTRVAAHWRIAISSLWGQNNDAYLSRELNMSLNQTRQAARRRGVPLTHIGLRHEGAFGWSTDGPPDFSHAAHASHGSTLLDVLPRTEDWWFRGVSVVHVVEDAEDDECSHASPDGDRDNDAHAKAILLVVLRWRCVGRDGGRRADRDHCDVADVREHSIRTV